jgi:hypothetical protein
MSLCAAVEQSICSCRLQPNNYDLCSQATTACTAGDPGCSGTGWHCPFPGYDGSYEPRHIKGTHGTPCRGSDTFDGQEKDGQLDCHVCGNAKGAKPRQFRGHHQDKCVGYHVNTGTKYNGYLWCKYP